MIAVHLEPKGLHRDAPPFEDNSGPARQKAAVSGSNRLRDAILAAMGIVLPVEPEPLTRSVAPQLCPTCSSPLSPHRVLVAEIQQTAAAYYGVSLHHLLSSARRGNIVRARQVAMYLASELTLHSSVEIGRRFNRDHSTVLHALKVMPARAEFDFELAYDIALLRGRLSA